MRTWALNFGFIAWYLFCKFTTYNVLPLTVYDLYLYTTTSSGEFFIFQVLAWYIQYQHIYSTEIYSKNVHSHTPRPKGAPKLPTYTRPPSVGMIYPVPTYIFNWYIFQKCTFSQPCARRAQWNSPTYTHPPRFGMLYPIQRYLFNWHIIQKCSNVQNVQKCSIIFHVTIPMS